MTREIEVAKNIILTYLSKDMTIESIHEIYEITHDNKQVLYNHIDALASIFTNAEKQLREDLLKEEGK